MRKLRRLRKWRETEAGQSLVEFAFILPAFLLLLFALVDFGRGFYTWLVVTQAAREGARAAAVQLDNNAINAKIYGSFCTTASPPSGCSLDTSKMTITKTNVQGARGSQATVEVNYTFSYVTPIGGIVNLVSGGSLSAPTISSTASMRLE